VDVGIAWPNFTAMDDTMKRSAPFIPDGMPEILKSSTLEDDGGRILDTTEHIREREKTRRMLQKSGRILLTLTESLRIMALRSIFFERCFL
jgi:hypothetical protein